MTQMCKRGQVTIFIIVGIIVLVSAFLSYWLFVTRVWEVPSDSPARVVLGGNCTDGTLSGQCSFIPPLYCSGGQLVSDCSVCGCGKDETCTASGECGSTVNENASFKVYFVPINYAPDDKEFLFRVEKIKAQLLGSAEFKHAGFVVVDETLILDPRLCLSASSKMHGLVDDWLQKRTGEGLPGKKFSGSIPLLSFRIIGIDSKPQDVSECGCAYSFTYAPRVYVGGQECSRGEHVVVHEVGHTFGLCDEYDTCVWEGQSNDLMRVYGHACLNSKPTKENSDCTNTCCSSTGACCSGKYADSKSDKFFNVMGSSDVPPKRRLSSETGRTINYYLCELLQVCDKK